MDDPVGAGEVVPLLDSGGQLPVDVEDEALHACFASASVYGSLSSFELAHLHRLLSSEPMQRYASDDVLWLEHDDEPEELLVLPLPLPPPPLPLSLLPQATAMKEAARRAHERFFMPL